MDDKEFIQNDNEEVCKCDENCNCVENCICDENCTCGENCDCDENHKCCDECTCENGSNSNEYDKKEKCDCKENEENNCACGTDADTIEEVENKDYLKDLLRVQAEFDNYRKRMVSSLSDARKDGFIDAITQFLPAIDSFKMATEYITDQGTLMGIKFIEKGILDTLSKMGVEVIDTTGKFNPEFHQAIDTEDNEDFESGDIIKEAYKGFTYKGKVIRYSQVIVQR